MNRSRLRLGAAAAAFLLLAVLFGTYFFDPAAVDSSVVFVAFVVLTLGAGLLAGSWWALALCVAAAIGVSRHVPVEFEFVAGLVVGLVAAVLLGIGIVFAKRIDRAWLVGAVLTAVCVLTVPLGFYRHVRPYDARPSAPVLVDPAAGAVGDVLLTEEMEAVRVRLGRPLAWEAYEGRGFLGYERVTVDYEGGRVFAIHTEDRRHQTAEGVGVGDSIAFARRQYPGLYCRRDGFRSVSCAARDGENILFLDGDPIHTLVISNVPCWPDVDGLGPDDNGDCPQARAFLRQPRA